MSHKFNDEQRNWTKQIGDRRAGLGMRRDFADNSPYTSFSSAIKFESESDVSGLSDAALANFAKYAFLEVLMQERGRHVGAVTALAYKRCIFFATSSRGGNQEKWLGVMDHGRHDDQPNNVDSIQHALSEKWKAGRLVLPDKAKNYWRRRWHGNLWRCGEINVLRVMEDTTGSFDLGTANSVDGRPDIRIVTYGQHPDPETETNDLDMPPDWNHGRPRVGVMEPCHGCDLILHDPDVGLHAREVPYTTVPSSDGCRTFKFTWLETNRRLEVNNGRPAHERGRPPANQKETDRPMTPY